jgi:glycosyltransferase involved in cell wall biosynthesis
MQAPPNRARPKVAIIAVWYPTPELPGWGSFVREHARALQRVADVAVIHLDTATPARRGVWTIADGEDDPGRRRLRVRVRNAPGLTTPLAAAGLRAALRRLARDGFVPDVLHAHVWAAGFLAVTARPRDVPVVLTEHFSGFATGTLSPLDLRLARLAFARADLVCPVSEDLAGRLRAVGVRAPLTVVANAIDVDRFQPREGPRAPGPVRALTVAGLTEIKRVDVLLEALALAAARPGAPAIELDVVGDGPLAAPLAAQARELRVTARFHGYQHGPAVARMMRDADMFVLPSRWENLPVVLLEAMASGIPSVASRVGGVPEIVDAGTGATVPPEDAGALAGALVDVAGRLDDFDPAALHERAAARYGFDAVARRWLELYALTRGPGGPT